MEDKKSMNVKLLEFQYERDIIKLLEDHGDSEMELGVLVVYRDYGRYDELVEVETSRIRVCKSGEDSWIEYKFDDDVDWHDLRWCCWYDLLRILRDTYSELCLIF